MGVPTTEIQNGRYVAWNATDLPLQLIRQLADIQFPSGIPGGGTLGTRVTLNCTAYPACQNRLVLAALQGTQFIKADSTLTDYTTSGNDLPFLTTFPHLPLPHPLPGDAGTVNYPVQQ